MTMFELTQLVIEAARDYKCHYDIKISSIRNSKSGDFIDAVSVIFSTIMRDETVIKETISFAFYEVDGKDLVYITDGSWESPYPICTSDISNIIEDILSAIVDAAEKYKKEKINGDKVK